MSVGNFSKRVLLTGAGFSKEFGGRIASEVWSDVIGHPAVNANAVTRDVLLRTPSFETALGKLSDAPYQPADKAALEAALQDAFRKMDSMVQQSTFGRGYGVNIYGFQSFISRFYGNPRQVDCGYIFSLNQDLVLERKYYNHHAARPPSRPGARIAPGQRGTNVTWFTTGHIAFDTTQIAAIDGPEDHDGPWPPALNGRFNYFKLHGSMDWVTASGGAMVMGAKKEGQIASVPLLQWYSDIFQRVLMAGDVRLMIMGYGFGDHHINQALGRAVREAGLRIYFWDTAPVSDLMNRVQGNPDGSDIWNAMCGHCSDPLSVVFPGSQDRTPILESMEKTFFGS